MSTQVEVLEAQAMKRTPDERARLADRLIASLSEDAEVEERGLLKWSGGSPRSRLGARV